MIKYKLPENGDLMNKFQADSTFFAGNLLSVMGKIQGKIFRSRNIIAPSQFRDNFGFISRSQKAFLSLHFINKTNHENS